MGGRRESRPSCSSKPLALCGRALSSDDRQGQDSLGVLRRLFLFFPSVKFLTNWCRTCSKRKTDGACVGLGDICFGNAQHDRVCEKTLSSRGPPVPSRVSREPLVIWRAATSSGAFWEDLEAVTVVLGANTDPVSHPPTHALLEWNHYFTFMGTSPSQRLLHMPNFHEPASLLAELLAFWVGCSSV